MSFNEGWSFHLGDTAGAEAAAFDDSGWRSLDLPHDWAIEGPFDVKYNCALRRTAVPWNRLVSHNRPGSSRRGRTGGVHHH